MTGPDFNETAVHQYRARRPPGLAIRDELEDYYGKGVHHGHLYPNLDTLVDKGLVEKEQRDQRTNMDTITDRGRKEIEAQRE